MERAEAYALALDRAKAGLTWSYPCLIWVADYVRDATGEDPAAGWRMVDWTEITAKSALRLLAKGGLGTTPVERALDMVAASEMWVEADGPRQGAIMVGVFDDDTGHGVPAIFDGDRRWLMSPTGKGWVATAEQPKRCWEIG